MIGIVKELVSPVLTKHPLIAGAVGLVLVVLVSLKGPGLITPWLGWGGEREKPKTTQLTTELAKVTAALTELRTQITPQREAFQSLLATYTQEVTRLRTELAKVAAEKNESSSDPVVALWHVNAISPLKVRQIQMQLKALGFDPGSIDGLYGPLTQAALCRYQAAQALLPLLDPRPDAQMLVYEQALSDVSTR